MIGWRAPEAVSSPDLREGRGGSGLSTWDPEGEEDLKLKDRTLAERMLVG